MYASCVRLLEGMKDDVCNHHSWTTCPAWACLAGSVVSRSLVPLPQDEKEDENSYNWLLGDRLVVLGTGCSYLDTAVWLMGKTLPTCRVPLELMTSRYNVLVVFFTMRGAGRTGHPENMASPAEICGATG